MNKIILAVAFFGLASCGRLDTNYIPSNPDHHVASKNPLNDVPILRLDNNNDGETYNYALETGDGISAQEQGDATGDGTKAQGGFSYTAPDGQVIRVQYVAGPDGFQAQGDHLPVAPEIPEEIRKAVEQNLADEARGVVDDGQYRPEASPSEKYGAAAVVKNQYVPAQTGYKGY
ncbi:endocuticle structural glycoprotein SgAbd-2 [Leptinotarsa decemlineata]|uniref:endocuticle structural glycoprotein SgAbd-2 n=1 Tax=Leptinotarsa decemlineata TaxID=7539 RepID=UPI000C25268F|nr:endocuticle structural glycoprotein SgAbd-2-like [Leptinotarsa decemlineata]